MSVIQSHLSNFPKEMLHFFQNMPHLKLLNNIIYLFNRKIENFQKMLSHDTFSPVFDFLTDTQIPKLLYR